MPKTYAELLSEARAEIREVTPAEVDALRRRAAIRPDRRPRGRGVGPGPPARRHPRRQELPRAADRAGRAVPGHARRPVLRRRDPLAVRGPDAGRDGLHGRRVDERRVRRLEGPGPGVDAAGRAHRPAEAPVQPPPADPRGGVRRAGAAAGLEGAAGRCGGPRVAGGAVPRGGGRRHDRHRGLRRRRPVEPAAPGDPRERPRRREEGRVRAEDHQRAEPGRDRDRPGGDAGRGQRGPAHRRVRRHRRRHRHVRDAVRPQRRGGRGRDPGRARVRVPVRGPADDVRAVRGAVLPLPLPDAAAAGAGARVLRGRRAGRGARDHGPAPGERGPEAAAGHGERARGTAAAVRCPRDRVHGAHAAARSGLSGLLGRGPGGPRGGAAAPGGAARRARARATGSSRSAGRGRPRAS